MGVHFYCCQVEQTPRQIMLANNVYIDHGVYLRNETRARITFAPDTFEAYARDSIVAPASASWRGNFFGAAEQMP